MDIEIEFLHKSFTEKDPKLLMEHIQRMAYGEAPFYSTTLSFVYNKLVEKRFPQFIPSGSSLEESVEFQSVADLCPPLSTSTSDNASSSSPKISPSLVWLRCMKTKCKARFI